MEHLENLKIVGAYVRKKKHAFNWTCDLRSEKRSSSGLTAMAAAKRRDRRALPDSSAGGRPGNPARTHRTRPMTSSIYRSPFVFFFPFALVFVPLALYFILRNPRSVSPILSVYERGLVKPNVAFHEILAVSRRIPPRCFPFLSGSQFPNFRFSGAL